MKQPEVIEHHHTTPPVTQPMYNSDDAIEHDKSLETFMLMMNQQISLIKE